MNAVGDGVSFVVESSGRQGATSPMSHESMCSHMRAEIAASSSSTANCSGDGHGYVSSDRLVSGGGGGAGSASLGARSGAQEPQERQPGRSPLSHTRVKLAQS